MSKYARFNTALGSQASAAQSQTPATAPAAQQQNGGVILAAPKEPGMLDRVFSTTNREHFNKGLFEQSGVNASDVVVRPTMEGLLSFGLSKISK